MTGVSRNCSDGNYFLLRRRTHLFGFDCIDELRFVQIHVAAYDGEDEFLQMQSGDYVNIPAHVRHRVEQTDADQETIWLAVHYD